MGDVSDEEEPDSSSVASASVGVLLDLAIIWQAIVPRTCKLCGHKSDEESPLFVEPGLPGEPPRWPWMQYKPVIECGKKKSRKHMARCAASVGTWVEPAASLQRTKVARTTACGSRAASSGTTPSCERSRNGSVCTMRTLSTSDYIVAQSLRVQLR